MRIQTHAGRFHADEVFAIGMLCLIESGGACAIPDTVTILRDRQASPSEADYVLDMGGGPYDHHHQISFRPSSPPVASEPPSDAIPYATAGLVWRDHGVRIINALHPDALTDDQKLRIQEDVDTMLIAGIDLADNGMRPLPAACHAYTIVDAIRDMNRLEQGARKQESQFREAVLMAMHILRTRIEASTYAQLARSRFHAVDWYQVGQVLVLPEYVPWKHNVLGDEGFSDIQFVVHPHPEAGWVTAAVPVDETTTGFRWTFPRLWRGKGELELPMITGVPTARFCHINGFIATSGSREDALALAEQALLSEKD